MEEALSVEQLIGITEQLTLLSAFLGGFSATFLAAILASAPLNRVANWMIICSSFAACCFIICAASSIAVANALQIGAEIDTLKFGTRTSSLSMALGLFALVACIGLSGWLRDKRTGLVTSSIAGVTSIFVAIFV